jgi:hypothetical protein
VQADNITARFEDGVLRVEVPRATKPEPRRIQVQPGEQARQDMGQDMGEGSSESSKQPVEASTQS